MEHSQQQLPNTTTVQGSEGESGSTIEYCADIGDGRVCLSSFCPEGWRAIEHAIATDSLPATSNVQDYIEKGSLSGKSFYFERGDGGNADRVMVWLRRSGRSFTIKELF
jgi:hypothetical protein